MDNKGVILISVIIIMLTIALIGASLMAFFTSVNLSVRATMDVAKAFYLAEAGIAHAISILQLQKETTDLDEPIGPFNLGEGIYIIEIDTMQSLIVSTGTVNDVEKTLQLQYSPL